MFPLKTSLVFTLCSCWVLFFIVTSPFFSFHLTSDFHYISSNCDCFLSLSSFLCTSLHLSPFDTLYASSPLSHLFFVQIQIHSVLCSHPSSILWITVLHASCRPSGVVHNVWVNHKRKCFLSLSFGLLSSVVRVNVYQSHPAGSDKGC